MWSGGLATRWILQSGGVSKGGDITHGATQCSFMMWNNYKSGYSFYQPAGWVYKLQCSSFCGSVCLSVPPPLDSLWEIPVIPFFSRHGQEIMLRIKIRTWWWEQQPKIREENNNKYYYKIWGILCWHQCYYLHSSSGTVISCIQDILFKLFALPNMQLNIKPIPVFLKIYPH